MKAVAITDIGRRRRSNQDRIFCSTTNVGALPNLFIVADGMGGEKAGDYASQACVETIVSEIRKSKAISCIQMLRNAIEKTNASLHAKSLEDKYMAGMGSTLVAAIIEGNTLYTFNVGDSRLYIMDENLTQISKDHSYVEEMVMLGEMTRDSKDYNKDKGVLTRAVGAFDNIDVDIFENELTSASRILLCSDGLTGQVDSDTIESIMKSERDIDSCAKKLIEAANAHGGFDNISVCIIDPEVSEVRE